MSEGTLPRGTTHTTDRRVAPPERTAWTGWVVFAACMMVLLGTFHAAAGLVALLKDEYYLVGKDGLVVSVDYTTWGWVHLILGLVVAFAGWSLWAGRTWARVTAVVVAIVSSLVNLGFLAAYPLWSTIMIAFDVLVIYAVTAHGGELAD